jgi:DNA-binding response OmpR family regulator
MRGTVLLLDDDRSRQLADSLRLNRLVVYEALNVLEAIEQLHSSYPDVIVACLAPDETRSVVQELRGAARDTSIIVTSGADQRDAARAAGAD